MCYPLDTYYLCQLTSIPIADANVNQLQMDFLDSLAGYCDSRALHRQLYSVS